MKFLVSFEERFEAESEEDSYDKVFEFLEDCIANGDLTPFSFHPIRCQTHDGVEDLNAISEDTPIYEDCDKCKEADEGGKQ